MSKNSILITTSNLSYPGGTEQFLYGFLRYLLSFKKVFDISLFENYSHGWHGDISVYNDLALSGLRVYEPSEPSGYDFYNPGRVRQLKKIILETEAKIVHSFLFNPDFTVFMAKYGSEWVFDRLIKKASSFEALPRIYPKIEEMKSCPVKKSTYGFKWISSKFCSFSVALEFPTNEWKIRKEVIDNEIEPEMSRFTDAVCGVSKSVCSRWAPWIRGKPYYTPCTSVEAEELAYIRRLERTRKDLRKKLGLDARGGRSFVAVSRLVLGKGLDELVGAFILHLKTSPDDFLIIVGDGDQRSMLETMTAGIKQIRFLGKLSRKEVFETLIAADFFCLFSHFEGLSLAVQEAMACARPILLSNVGGMKELVFPGVNGMTCPPGDIPKIKNLLDWAGGIESSKIEQMGKESRRIIENNFVCETTYDKIIDIYRGLIERK